jgi:hypothetical protein
MLCRMAGVCAGIIRCDRSCSGNYLLLVMKYFICLLLGYDTVYCGVCMQAYRSVFRAKLKVI